jgi:rod shape-determining protein MreB
MSHLKREYSLLIGDHMAERIKIEIGSAFPLPEKKQMAVKGRDLVSGIPRTIFIDDTEIREALHDCISTIVGAVRLALEHTPPELAGDIIDRGIVLTGGGSLLQGLDDRLREETGLPIVTVDDPLSSVVMGVGKTLEELSLLRKVSTYSSLNP